MTKISEIRRGVEDPAGTAAFFSWLLDIEPEQEDEQFRFRCANGSLLIHGDADLPVGLELSHADLSFRDVDPDGVPVVAVPPATRPALDTGLQLDHVRLNCGDLSAAAGFYRQLGFALSWSGRGDDEFNGPQDAPMEGANWLHLSCDDGYLSLSQADWGDYGAHSTASGPPRFMHIGLAVSELAEVVARLDQAGMRYLRGNPAVGRNLYVNDPNGEARLGTNVEIIRYLPGVQRSGMPVSSARMA